MPSRSLPIRLSKKARQDFVDILRYTASTWGPHQLEVYRDRIAAALQAIGRNPELGHKCQDLPATHRAFFVGAHIIGCCIGDQGLAVVRILHQRTSLSSWVTGR